MNSSRVFIILSVLLVLIWLLVDETEAQFEGPIKKRRRRRSGKRRRCCRNRRHRNDGDKKKQSFEDQRSSTTQRTRGMFSLY